MFVDFRSSGDDPTDPYSVSEPPVPVQILNPFNGTNNSAVGLLKISGTMDNVFYLIFIIHK